MEIGVKIKNDLKKYSEKLERGFRKIKIFKKK